MKLDQAIIRQLTTAARKLNVETAALAAFVAAESAGVTFWNVGGKRLPAIRFEGHYFHRLTKGETKQKAIAAGLAHPRAGKVKNPRAYAARWDLFWRAHAIDPEAAIRSTSWGVGQVMGEHFKRLGFASPAALMDSAMDGLGGQVELMVRFIRMDKKLIAAIKQKAWRTIARIYNGPAYKRNKYHIKMRDFYRRFSHSLASTFSAAPLLKKAGYPVGRYKTERAAIVDFQTANGLVPDGIAGPMTLEALEEAIKARKAKTAKHLAPAAAAGGVSAIAGAGKALEAVQEAGPVADQAVGLLNMIGLPGWAVGLLVAAAVGGVVWYLLRDNAPTEASA